MDNKNLNPNEPEQQWLKDLFDEAEATPQPAEAAADFSADDDAWLQELFASTEQAAEQEFAWDAPPAGEVPAEEAPSSAKSAGRQWAPKGAEDEAIQPLDPEITAFLESIMPLEDQEPAPIQPEPAPEEAEPEPAPEEAQVLSEEEDVPQPTGKRRPRNKQGYSLFGLPHLMVTAVWIAIILMIGGFLGQWIWRGASDVLAFGREEKVVTITITDEDDLDSVINKLHAAGLVNEPMWFRWYAQISDVMEDIGTGTYELNTLYDYRALVSHMSPSSSARLTVRVVIPEGYTCAQIFALMEEKGVCTAAELEEASVNEDFSDYWFLEGVTQDSKYCLEGYLFPDTYEFYTDEDAARVLKVLLNNFDKRFNDVMAQRLATLNDKMAQKMRANGMSEEYIQAHQFTIREVVIIASLIEKEAIGAEEAYAFSSMIYNQLTHSEKHPCLEMNRPLIYITGHSTLTEEDYALDSPYNTFLYPGLIPTPICNPSRASLDAALDPTETDYYYFAYEPLTNSHHFFASESKWQAFIDALPSEEDGQ